MSNNYVQWRSALSRLWTWVTLSISYNYVKFIQPCKGFEIESLCPFLKTIWNAISLFQVLIMGHSVHFLQLCEMKSALSNIWTWSLRPFPTTMGNAISLIQILNMGHCVHLLHYEKCNQPYQGSEHMSLSPFSKTMWNAISCPVSEHGSRCQFHTTMLNLISLVQVINMGQCVHFLQLNVMQ